MKKYIFVILISGLLSGCIATTITATNNTIIQKQYKKILMDPFTKQNDRNLTPGYEFNKDVVSGMWRIEKNVETHGYEISKDIEREITSLLRNRNIEVLSLAEEFLDKPEPKREDIEKLVKEFKPDAIFYVVYEGARLEQFEMNVVTPRMVFTKKNEKPRVLSKPGKIGPSSFMYTGTTKGGHNIYTYWGFEKQEVTFYVARCSFYIYGCEIQNFVWEATTKTRDMIEKKSAKGKKNIALKVVDKLVKDKIIP